MRFSFPFFPVLLALAFAFSRADAEQIAEKGKTGVPGIDSLPTYEWDVETSHTSLPLTLLFGIFPGGGQYYTGHYIRGDSLRRLNSG